MTLYSNFSATTTLTWKAYASNKRSKKVETEKGKISWEKQKYSRARVANVSSTLVKRHDRLHLEPMLLGHLQQLRIPSPIVLPWFLSLHQAPPHVHHHPFHPGTLQRLQARVHRLPPVNSVPHCHAVQWHHHVNWHPLRLILCIKADGVRYKWCLSQQYLIVCSQTHKKKKSI